MYVNGKQVNTKLLTSGERGLIEWQYSMPMGSFRSTLWKAISLADESNLAALAKGFPSEVTAYEHYIRAPGYWERLLVRAGLIPPRDVREADPHKLTCHKCREQHAHDHTGPCEFCGADAENIYI